MSITTFIRDNILVSASEKLKDFLAKTGGTEIYAAKSVIDAIGTDGNDTLTHDFSESGLMQYAHGRHDTTYILFIIPEAVGVINAHNTAIQTHLEKFGRVYTITQSDALDYPDYGSYTICVLGTDNGTAWVTANLANIKVVPSLPVICCDSSSAAYLEIGTDGGDAVNKTVLNAIANIEASFLGMGAHGCVGLAVGANTIADAGTTFNTLDMSDADLTETWYGYESVNANTDVILGMVRRIQPDASIGIDEEGAEVEKTIAYYGPAYSYNALNSLGQDVLCNLVLMLIHSRTIGQAVTLAGDIGNVETKLFGNMTTKFSTATPLAKFIAGTNVGLGDPMPNSKALYNILGTNYIDGGGNPDVDNIAEHLRAGVLNGTGTVLPANKSLYDAILGQIDASNRKAGNTQILEVSVTSAANVGDVTLATITTQPCIIDSIIIHADAGQTGDLTSCAVYGGASKVITFIDSIDAIQANLNAADKQVAWLAANDGAVRLAATKTIIMTLAGTGATNVNLTVTIIYRSAVDGGYLT